MKNNTIKKKICVFLCVLFSVAIVIGSIPMSIAADGTQTEEEQSTVKIKDYSGLNDDKITGKPYNAEHSSLYFDKSAVSKNNSYFTFRFIVEKETIVSKFSKTPSKDNIYLEFLWREKNQEDTEDGKWTSGKADLVSAEFKELDGSNWLYLISNTYDGGMKVLEAGKTYELAFEIYEKTDSGKNASRLSTEVYSVEFTSEMQSAKKEFFAKRAGVTLDDNGMPSQRVHDNFLDYVSVPMGVVLQFCFKLTKNYLLAIFLLTLILKVILYPLGIKQQKNMINQAKFTPKEMAIRKKYAGRTDSETMRKVQMEIAEAKQKENVKITAGCLPLLVQMFIIICLFAVIRNPLKYTSGVSSDIIRLAKQVLVDLGLSGGKTLSELNDVNFMSMLREGNNFSIVSDFLSANFGIENVGNITSPASLPNFELFKGFNIAETPSFANLNWLIVIPLFVFISYYFSMKLTKKLSYQPPKMPNSPDVNLSFKIMDVAMPALSTVLCFTVPSMLGIYWIFQSILGVLQQFLLKKMYPFPVFTAEDYKKAELEYTGKQPKRKPSVQRNSKVRSLHRIDEEDDEDKDLPLSDGVLKNGENNSEAKSKEEQNRTPEKNKKQKNKNKATQAKEDVFLIEKTEFQDDNEKNNK